MERTQQTPSFNRTKIAFASIWNNFKHGFHSTFTTKFNHNSPICLLGQFYHIKMDEPSEDELNNARATCGIDNRQDNDEKSDESSMATYVYNRFKTDFCSRIWLTYRKDFSVIPKSNLTTDTGWGCMIRSGQMILAQALVQHFLGREWIWKDLEYHNNDGDDDEVFHRKIVQWFLDDPNPIKCPFSLHELVKIGHKFGKGPGDWFGPASISFVLKAAIEKASENISELSDTCCYIAQDCTIYLQDLLELCCSNNISSKNSNDFCSSSETSSDLSIWRSVMILIPARLGTKHFNPLYSPHIKQILSLPQCIGIIGGRPKHSLYFVGFQDDKLIYLDPHYSQKAVTLNDEKFNLESFHCHTPRKASLHSIDPSCAIGFYIKSKEEFDQFLDGIQQIVEHTKQVNDYPVFIVNDGKSCQFEAHLAEQMKEEKVLRMKYHLVDSLGNVQKVINAEEFILL